MSVTTATGVRPWSERTGSCGSYPAPVAVTLVTGATGLVGSHVARLLVERGDDVRIAVRAPRSRSSSSRASTSRRSHADVLDRARSAARCAASTRVFHVAGMTSLRGGRRRALPRQRRRHAHRAGGGAARGRRARRPHLVGRRRRTGAARVDRRRDADLQRRRATGCPTSTPSTRRRPRRCGSPRTGCRSSSSTRRTCSAGATSPLVHRARAPLPAPRDPGLRRRRAEHRGRRGRRARAPAGRRASGTRASATSSATATSRSTASSPTSGACRASSRRR